MSIRSLEIAKAFDAPLLRNVIHDPTQPGWIRSAGGSKIQYGGGSGPEKSRVSAYVGGQEMRLAAHAGVQQRWSVMVR